MRGRTGAGRIVWLIFLVVSMAWSQDVSRDGWKIVLKTLPDMPSAVEVRDRYADVWQKIAELERSTGAFCARPSGRYAIVAVEPLSYEEAKRVVKWLKRDFPDAFINRVSAQTLASADRRCLESPIRAAEPSDDKVVNATNAVDTAAKTSERNTSVASAVSTDMAERNASAPAASEQKRESEADKSTQPAEAMFGGSAVSEKSSGLNETADKSVVSKSTEMTKSDSTPPSAPSKKVKKTVASTRAQGVVEQIGDMVDRLPMAYLAGGALLFLVILGWLYGRARAAKRRAQALRVRKRRQAEALKGFAVMQKEIEELIALPKKDGCEKGFFHTPATATVEELIGGRRELRHETFELNKMLERLAASLGRLRNGTHICMVYDIGRSIPLRLVGDVDALIWLCGAMALRVSRHMARGSVVIQLSWRAGVESRTMLDIAVTADGYEAVPVDDEAAGIDAIRELVETMDGTLRMRRAPDGMPSYWTRIPLGVEDANNRRKYRLPSRKLMRKKVLVVDSCPRSGWAIDKMLKYFHYDVTTATHWRGEKVREEAYDAIFVESAFLPDVKREMKAGDLPPVVAICRSCADSACEKWNGPLLRRPFNHKEIFAILVETFVTAE